LFDLFGFRVFGDDTSPPLTAARMDGMDSRDFVAFGMFDADSLVLVGFELFPLISDLAENNSPLLTVLISPVATVGIGIVSNCLTSRIV
jgi:hypothetical protein